MKKLGLGKRVLACAASAATLLTGTTALSGLTTLGSMAASAASYDNYAKLLQYSMYFYDGNMCGTEVQDNNRYTWRGNCHTYDAQVAMNSTATNLSADFLTKYKDCLLYTSPSPRD